MFFDLSFQTEFAKSVTQLATSFTNTAAAASAEFLTSSTRISQELILGKTYELKSSKGKSVEIRSPNINNIAIQSISNCFEITAKLGEITAKNIFNQWENTASNFPPKFTPSTGHSTNTTPWNGFLPRGSGFPYPDLTDPEFYRTIENTMKAGRLTAEWMKLFNLPSNFLVNPSAMQPTNELPNFANLLQSKSIPPFFWTMVPNKNLWKTQF